VYQNDLLVASCDIINWSNSTFDCYLGPIKVPPPFVQSSIKKQMKSNRGDEALDLSRRQNRGSHMILGPY